MAFLSLTDLTARTITRLRMVGGSSTQLYANDAIALMLEEAYEMVRVERWWDHLMQWQNRQLTGTNGLVTATFDGARERFRDIQHIYNASNNIPVPILSADINPYRLTGTAVRFVEPLNTQDDPSGIYLFRVWPQTAVTTVDKPLRIRLRSDPANLFTAPATIIPFDATCLVNCAAFKYAADDGTNPASVEQLRQSYEARMDQLKRQHDNATILLDPRQGDPTGLTEWTETWR